MTKSSSSSSVPVLLAGVWFGLLTGFSEIALLGIKKVYLGRFIRFGPEVAWMAPLTSTLVFVIMASILLAIGRRVPRSASPRLAYGTLSFFGFLSLLLMYYPLQMYAKLLLAAGLAVQAVRMMERWPAGFHTLVRRSTPAMAALVIVLAAGVGAGRWMTLRQSQALLPGAPAGVPNVLLIVLDTVRAQNLSLYGYDRETTPNLERWADTSVVFDDAASTSPWTLPSHASMFTGRWPHELSTSWEVPLDGQDPTLAEVLASHGYATAGFVANTYYVGYELGLGRGFSHYEDYVVSARELLISSTLVRSTLNSKLFRRAFGYYDNIPRKNAAAINDRFLSWASGVRDRPFFAFLNYFDAHETYLPPAPFTERFGPDLPRGNELLGQDLRRSLRSDWLERPPQEIQTEMDMYDGALAYIDDQLDRLFNELRARGVLDSTIVIVTADHGEQFGEHGLFLHGNSLYEPLLHVPLMISLPGSASGGQRIASTVSLRDLPATVMDLIGIQADTVFPGRSLARYWSGGNEPSRGTEVVLSEVAYAAWAEEFFPSYPTAAGDMQSLSDGRYRYIRNGDGREELYSLHDDPGQEHDLSQLEAHQKLLERFRMELTRLLKGS